MMTDHTASLAFDLADGLDGTECGLWAAYRAALALGRDDLARQLDPLHGELVNIIPRDQRRLSGEARDQLGWADDQADDAA